MSLILLRILAGICLFLVLPLQAQVQGTFPVRRYGTEQGLGSEVVSALVQDRAGRFWVGTQGGLCFFDGRRFSPFNGALPSQFVTGLSLDLDDAIWVSTEGGLARISQGRSRIFGIADGIPPGSVNEVARDAGGHLWVLTSQGVRVERGADGFIPPGPWPDKELPKHLFADQALPGVWALTPRTIWYWEKDGWTRLASPNLASREVFTDLAVDGDRNLWVRTSSSLWRRATQEGAAWTGEKMSGGLSHISKLSRDREGWVWVDNTEGLWRMKGPVRERFGHAKDDARGGMVDQEGGFWLRTDKGILRVLGQNRWRVYGPQDGLPMETCWQMVRDRQGRIWVCTDSGLWVMEEKRFWKVIPGRILNLAHGPDGSLWASGSPGGVVHQVDTRTLGFTSLRIEMLPVARITAGIAVDATGHLWVADEQDGLVRGLPTGGGRAWESLRPGSSNPRDVKAILALPEDGILLLHDRSASIWRGGEWHQVPDLLPELPSSAAVTPDGRLVIGYLNRPVLTVHRLQGNRLVRTGVIDLPVGKRQLTVFSVAFGGQGRIWTGTSLGLGYLDGEDPASFRLLGTEDRIVSPECNESSLLVEPNRVWIGTPLGFMSYDPLLNPARGELRAPLLLSVQTKARELDLFDPLPELARTSNELEVKFMVPNYQMQGQLTYEAKLSGVDSDWIRLDTPFLRYAGLHAGLHALQLRGMTPEGAPGPVTTFRFRVRPAWWERGWVRVLGLVGFIGLVTLLVKLRQAQLEQRNRELIDEVTRQTSALVAASKAKSAFLANMSHELRTPLNAILLYSEILQEDMKDPALERLRKDAGKIQSAGHHLLGLIDDILDMSKIEAGRLRLELKEIEVGTFLHDLDATVRPLVEKNGNRFEVVLEEVPDHITSDPTRLRQVLVNLLSNSAKFTSGGQVLLKAWSTGDDLMALVKDTGIGMTEEQQARVFQEFVQADDSTTRRFGGTGLGLTLVKKFIDLLGGEIAMESKPGEGTTFTIRIPRSGPAPDAASREA